MHTRVTGPPAEPAWRVAELATAAVMAGNTGGVHQTCVSKTLGRRGFGKGSEVPSFVQASRTEDDRETFQALLASVGHSSARTPRSILAPLKITWPYC